MLQTSSETKINKEMLLLVEHRYSWYKVIYHSTLDTKVQSVIISNILLNYITVPLFCFLCTILIASMMGSPKSGSENSDTETAIMNTEATNESFTDDMCHF